MLSNPVLRVLIVASFAGIPTAHAIVTTGASDGYGIKASASSTLIVPATPDASGTAPSGYDTGLLTGIAIGLTAVGPISLTTGTLNARAQSNVDGISGPATTSAFGQVNSTQINLGSTIQGSLSLTTGILSSTSSVMGDFGSLSRTGSSNIADLSLVYDPFILSGSNTVFNLSSSVGPNTDLSSLLPGGSEIGTALGLLGISIMLNEQFGTCNFVSFCEQTTNALHIVVNPLSLADVTLGHSYAQQTAAIPEASTYGMMLAGLGLIGAMVARRRNKVINYSSF